MNKGYMIVNNQVIVGTEEGLKGPIACVNNIEDILLYENEVEFLSKMLKEDSSYLLSKKYERETTKKSAIKIAIMSGGAALAAGSICYLGASFVPELVNNFAVQSVIGTVTLGGAFLGLGMALMEFQHRPSKKLISSYEERVNYEKEMLDIISGELELLKLNSTNDIESKDEMISHKIKDEGSIKYLNDSIRLRDIYGYNKAKILKLYYEDELIQLLRERNFDSNAIMDFMLYLDTEVRKYDKEEVVGKIKK